MERVEKYQVLLEAVLEEYAQPKTSSDTKEVEYQVIIDKERQHYLLMSVGWLNERKHIHNCLFHFDIKDGKIWIQQNRTDIEIGEELVKRGVPREDIVLGLQPPYVRPYTDYAAA